MYICVYIFYYRKNPGVVTRCAYLELMTSLLAQPMIIEQPSTIDALVILLKQTWQSVLDSMKEQCSPEQEDVIVSSCKLLFICTSQPHTKPATISSSLPAITPICTECLQHSSVAVRQCTLQYILNHSELFCWEEDAFISLLITHFSTEVDEMVLASLCSVLPKALKQQSHQIGSALYKTALYHATRTYLRYLFMTYLHVIVCAGV